MALSKAGFKSRRSFAALSYQRFRWPHFHCGDTGSSPVRVIMDSMNMRQRAVHRSFKPPAGYAEHSFLPLSNMSPQAKGRDRVATNHLMRVQVAPGMLRLRQKWSCSGLWCRLTRVQIPSATLKILWDLCRRQRQTAFAEPPLPSDHPPGRQR